MRVPVHGAGELEVVIAKFQGFLAFRRRRRHTEYLGRNELDQSERARIGMHVTKRYNAQDPTLVNGW